MGWIWWLFGGLLIITVGLFAFLLWLLKHNIYSIAQIKDYVKNKKK